MSDETAKDIDEALAAPSLLTQLVCPVTKGPLRYDKPTQQLISVQIKKAFPIRSGVPILLIEEARDITITETDIPQSSSNHEV